MFQRPQLGRIVSIYRPVLEAMQEARQHEFAPALLEVRVSRVPFGAVAQAGMGKPQPAVSRVNGSELERDDGPLSARVGERGRCVPREGEPLEWLE